MWEKGLLDKWVGGKCLCMYISGELIYIGGCSILSESPDWMHIVMFLSDFFPDEKGEKQISMVWIYLLQICHLLICTY